MDESPFEIVARRRPWRGGPVDLSGLLLFWREMLADPRHIGAICPSSMGLARALAACVPTDETGMVLELGAGTGAVTDALLARGVAPHRLLVVERSVRLAELLQQRFPQVTVICGDAGRLAELFAVSALRVSMAVSSLPLKSMPAPVVAAIVAQLHDVLASGAMLAQYSYAHWSRSVWHSAGFARIGTKTVWGNLPPARVDLYRRL